MKLLTFLITLNSIVCFGQDIFKDNIKNFSWASDKQLDIGQLPATKEIRLSLLRIPKDSLKVDRTLWAFKEDLTVSDYHANDRKETQLLRCAYEFDWSNGLLKIQWPDQAPLTYHFTFVSTGSFLLLTRKTNK